MKIVSYNITFGFNGRSLIRNAINHFYIHVVKSSRLVRAQATCVQEVMDLALGFQPDILCFNEILPHIFGEEVRQKLAEVGFVTVAEGSERHHPYPLQIATFLAVREQAEIVAIDLPHLNETGGGGGICGLYIPSKKMTVFGVHLGLKQKKRAEQLRVLSEYIALQRILDRRVVLAGDFNCSLEEIQKHPSFVSLNLEGCNVPTNTYARMPLKLGLSPDLDHVLWTREFDLHQAVAQQGSSDHDLVFCELQELQ